MKISWYIAVIVRHSIVECRYNAVQYNMILQASLQELGQNTNQSQNLTSELWVPFVNVDRRNLTAFNSTGLYKLTVIHVAFIVALLTLIYITLLGQISKLPVRTIYYTAQLGVFQCNNYCQQCQQHPISPYIYQVMVCGTRHAVAKWVILLRTCFDALSNQIYSVK